MRSWKDFDWIVLFITILLCIVGVMFIYSAFHPYSKEPGQGVEYTYVKRQLLWILAGSVALLVGLKVKFRYFETLAFVFYGALILLLIAVLFLSPEARAQRWISLGPANFQPSEFGKIVLLFVWARVLSGHRRNPNKIQNLLMACSILLLPFLLVLKEPDMGTAMIYAALMLAVLYWRGLSGWKLFYLVSPVIACLLVLYGDKISPDKPYSALPLGIFLVAVFIIAYVRRHDLAGSLYLLVSNLGVGLVVSKLWMHLMPYQQKRILNFLDPGSDKLSAGWQVLQSKIAIGSGGVLGKTFLHGTQKSLEFVPASHTDFIFSIIGEELGFMGSVLALMLFFILIVRALRIATKCKSEFASTVCLGIAFYFFLQVFVNVGMTTGMAPVTGIPLPLVSYGGSSMVVSMFMVGFLLNCSARWYEY